MANEKEFKPKYVARVSVGKDKYRYFYTQAEYQAYLKGEDSTKEDASSKTDTKKEDIKTTKKSKTSSLLGGLKKAVSTIGNTVKKGVAAVEKTLKKTGDTLVSKVVSSAAAKTGKKAVTDLVNKSKTLSNETIMYGKTATDTALKNIGNKSIKSPDIASKISKGLKAVGSVLDKLFNKVVSGVKKVASNVANTIKSLTTKKSKTPVKPEEDKKTEEPESTKPEDDKKSEEPESTKPEEDKKSEEPESTKPEEDKKTEESTEPEEEEDPADRYQKFLTSKPPASFDELKHTDSTPESPRTLPEFTEPEMYDEDGYYTWQYEWYMDDPEGYKDYWENDVASEIFKDELESINKDNFTEANKTVPRDIAATQNCSYCTAAYELRRRGYDVTAAPYAETDDAPTIHETMSWYKDAKLESTGAYDPDDAKELQDNINKTTKGILEQGDGARGNITFYFGDYGYAHSVAYEVVSGKVVLLDCQIGTVLDLETEMSKSVMTNYYRTDNLELNDKILKKVRNND